MMPLPMCGFQFVFPLLNETVFRLWGQNLLDEPVLVKPLLTVFVDGCGFKVKKSQTLEIRKWVYYFRIGHYGLPFNVIIFLFTC